MKKINYSLVFILLFSLFALNLFLLGDSNSFDPETIEPQLMIASGKLVDIYYIPENFTHEGASAGHGWIGQGVSTAGANLIGHVNITIEFWNIGAQGNNIYNIFEQQKISQEKGIDPTSMYYGFGTVLWKTVYEGEQYSGCDVWNTFGHLLGNFSGGPQGVIKPDWYSDIYWEEQWPIINGNYILIGFNGNEFMSPPADAEIPITNYKAFLNEQSASEPEDTVDTGSGSERVEVERELKAPTIELILKGPIESGSSQNSFIVEAVVTGNPEPAVTFSRDDSYGSMGKYRALINMGPDSELTVTATATNSAGSDSDQVNISTKKQLSVKLDIVKGPEYISRVMCYYFLRVTIEGSPLPEEFTLNHGNETLKFDLSDTGSGGSKYTCLLKIFNGVYGENSRCEDKNITVTVSKKNNSKSKASASIVLPWIPAPDGIFTSAYDYLKISKVKGKFQMKREKELSIPDMWSSGFTEVQNPQWEDYEGCGGIWIGDEIKTGNEPLIIEFLEDGSKFMLAPNSWMKVTESGIQLKDGEGRFTITKTKEGIRTLKNSFFSNFSFSTITGTSFVINARNNQTLLKVLEGTVEIYSTATCTYNDVSAGEAINSSESGLSKKAVFSVDEEKSFWEQLEKEGTYYERENNFFSNSSILGLPPYVMVLIIVLMLMVYIALGAVIILLKKYKYF